MQQYRTVVLSTSLAALFLMGGSAVHAENTARPGGEKTVSCEQCHGVRGAAPVQSLIPKLCGQNVEYLETTLLQFQDGRRPHPIMRATTRLLPKDVIKQLAVYYANAPCSQK